MEEEQDKKENTQKETDESPPQEEEPTLLSTTLLTKEAADELLDISQTKQKISPDVEVPKPSVILLRFYDVIASNKKNADEYLKYSRDHMYSFLTEFWGNTHLMEVIENLRYQSKSDRIANRSAPRIFKSSQTRKAIIESIIYYMTWRMDLQPLHEYLSEDPNGPHFVLHRIIWADGVAKGKLKIHIYRDVANAFLTWRQQDIKVYIFSSCTADRVEGDKRVISKTTSGDLTRLVDGYFDTQLYDKSKFESFITMCNELSILPEKMLFVTKDMTEATLTSHNGMSTVIVIRSDVDFPSHVDLTQMAIVNNLGHIKFLEAQPR